MTDRGDEPVLSRRRFLGAGLAGLVLAACSDGGDGDDGAASDPDATTTSGPAERGDGGDPAPTEQADAPLTAADFEGLGVCALLPEQMAGPFPLDEQFDRRDVTEGVPGRPMRLGFRVVDAACAPVPGASVEIWHCDASGDYSAFTDGGGGKDEGEGTTFLRGTRTAGDDGIVDFATIVPGWYTGRAVHVHLRVRVEDGLVLTSQVYFDPALIAEVYEAEPYSEFGPPDTSNEDDAIAGDPPTDGTLLHTTAGTAPGSTLLALLNLGVDPQRAA